MGTVRIATSLGRSGLQDWLLQRFTAIILLLYIGFWVVYGLYYPTLNYDSWKDLFNHDLMRFSSLIALLCLLIHAWIGIWTVTTDYLKIVSLRLLCQSLFGLGLLYCLLWGFKILWGE